MKLCPQCRKHYEDEFFFCFDDGRPLVEYRVDPNAPTEADISVGGSARTEVLPGNRFRADTFQQPAPSEPTADLPATRAVPRPVHETRELYAKRTSPITYVLIGALGATCLALVGVLVFMNRDQLFGPRERPALASNAAPGASATPSTTTTAANTSNAVLNPTPKPSPKPVSPVGRWRGEWSTESGTLLDFDLTLTELGDRRVEGRIVWTMRRTVRPDKASKVGLSATEFVRGTYEDDGSLNMSGYRKDDPDDVLVMLDQYRLKVSEDGRSLTGSARNGGKWNGRVRLSKVQAGS